MFYVTIYQLVIACLFALAGGLCVVNRRPDLLITLAIVSLGFGNFWIYAAGSVWLPVKIIGVWSVVYVVLSYRRSHQIPARIQTLFTILLSVVLLGFVMGYLIPTSYGNGDSGGTQGTLFRPLIQLIGYLSALSFVPLSLAASRVPKAFERIFGYYAVAVLVVCIVGVYQFVALKVGIGFMPIYRWNGINSDLAAFNFGTRVVTRLYSLAGEPKALGIFLTPFVVGGIVLSLSLRTAYRPWWNRRWLFIFAGVIDVLTYSSAVLIAIGVAALVSVAVASQKGTRVAVLALVPVVLIFSVLNGSVLNSVTTNNNGIEDIIYARTVERVADVYQKRNETHALELLYDDPLHLVTGLGLGMYVFHLPGLYFGSGVEPMDSGWVISLVDLGLLGASILFLFIYSAARCALVATVGTDPVDVIQLRILASCVVAICALQLGTNSLVSVMIWSGLAIAISSAKVAHGDMGFSQGSHAVNSSTNAFAS